MADTAANEARTIPGPRRSTSLAGIIPVINSLIKDPPCRPKYSYIATAYSKMSKSREQSIKSRWESVYLARLRSGHHWDLRSYLHRITKNSNGPVVDPKCPRCGMQDDDTPHLFECVGTMQVRQELYGTVDVNLSALTEYPMRSIALSRRSLRGAVLGTRPRQQEQPKQQPVQPPKQPKPPINETKNSSHQSGYTWSYPCLRIEKA